VLTKGYEIRQNGRKIQNGVKTYVFVFLLSNAQLKPDFKILFCIRSEFIVRFFFGYQNGGLVQDGVIFEKKSIFL
jgi:hypothetical protein